MSDRLTEPATEAPVVVVEDSEQDRERMRVLDERVRGHVGPEPDDADVGVRGGFGSPETMIAEARKHLGYRETGENDTIFNRWLGAIGGYPHDGFGYPWCHSFVSYCLGHSDNDDAGPRTAGCVVGAEWFKMRGRFSGTPSVGDLVYYGPNGGTHVELVIGVTPGSIQTIGGNTSGSIGGRGFFNGDGVYEKTVARTSRIHGFGHPQYSTGGAARGAAAPGAPAPGAAPARAAGAAVTPLTSVRSIRKQQEAVNSLGRKPPLDLDGEWGPKTEAGVKWLQKKIGAGVDGEWGNETERLFAAFAK